MEQPRQAQQWGPELEAPALPSCVVLDGDPPSLSLSVLSCKEAIRCLAEDLSC